MTMQWICILLTLLQNQVMYRVKVFGDGNCLPHCGNIHAFGSDKHGIEIRVRIIVEAVTNKDFYLSHNYLDQGTSGSKCLPKAFAMYSDEYVPSSRLENEDIENIYEKK